MGEFRYSLPGEGLPPNTKRSLQIQTLVQRIEDGFVVDVNNSFQELCPIVLPFRVIVVGVEFNACQKTILEGFEGAAWQHKCTNKILLLILCVLLGVVHIFQHFQRTRSHGYANPIHQLPAGSCHKNENYWRRSS